MPNRAAELRRARQLHQEACDAQRALAARVRAALRTGELALTANRAYGARGAGETCSVCGHVIGFEDVLYEVLEPRRAQAHLECYQLWQTESRRILGGGERFGPWELI
jgi:hypothetical protein